MWLVLGSLILFVSNSYSLVVIAIFSYGFGLSLCGITINSTIQMYSPRKHIGKVIAANSFLLY